MNHQTNSTKKLKIKNTTNPRTTRVPNVHGRAAATGGGRDVFDDFADAGGGDGGSVGVGVVACAGAGAGGVGGGVCSGSSGSGRGIGGGGGGRRGEYTAGRRS